MITACLSTQLCIPLNPLIHLLLQPRLQWQGLSRLCPGGTSEDLASGMWTSTSCFLPKIVSNFCSKKQPCELTMHSHMHLKWRTQCLHQIDQENLGADTNASPFCPLSGEFWDTLLGVYSSKRSSSCMVVKSGTHS